MQLLDAVPPSGAATVMGTGIVSVALDLDGRVTLSRILLAVAAALWVAVFASFLRRALWQRERWRREARSPEQLTIVAGTAVLGARATLLGQDWAGYVLLVVAVVLWIGLVPRVLRHWETPTVGVSFLVPVATESLAVLAALLAIDAHVGWLAALGLAPLAVGLAAYPYALVRVDLRQLVTGSGDHWIFGGALAIATLACAQVTVALHATGEIAGGRRILEGITIALWAAAVLWVPALLAGEVIAPRLGYENRRWSTAFPVGMYAAATVVTGRLLGIGGLVSAGRVWVWPALALWAVAVAGMLARASRARLG